MNWDEAYNLKCIEPEDLQKKVHELRSVGNTIVTLNGSFDLFHSGHLHILFEAKKQGDILIVGLNTDESIAKYKSADRPIIPLEQRLKLMASIEFVDYVTYFSETDPREILRIIKPDVHVNGGEYGEECIEANVVKEGGGRVHVVERLPGLSTSELIGLVKRCV